MIFDTISKRRNSFGSVTCSIFSTWTYHLIRRSRFNKVVEWKTSTVFNFIVKSKWKFSPEICSWQVAALNMSSKDGGNLELNDSFAFMVTSAVLHINLMVASSKKYLVTLNFFFSSSSCTNLDMRMSPESDKSRKTLRDMALRHNILCVRMWVRTSWSVKCLRIVNFHLCSL